MSTDSGVLKLRTHLIVRIQEQLLYQTQRASIRNCYAITV